MSCVIICISWKAWKKTVLPATTVWLLMTSEGFLFVYNGDHRIIGGLAFSFVLFFILIQYYKSLCSSKRDIKPSDHTVI